MADLFQSDCAKGVFGAPYPSTAGETVARRFEIAVTAGMVGTIDNIFELAPIPAGCAPVDFILDSDDLDSDGSPALLIDVGIMSGSFGDNDSARTCGDEIFDGSNIGQAGGVVRPTLKSAFRIAPADYDRSIGIKVATAAATGAEGSIGLIVFYSAP